MAIELNHTIVPAHDKEKSAKFFARIFGLSYDGEVAHFAPVRVNGSLTMDFDNRSEFKSHHYAFKVSDEDFDRIFGLIREEGIPYGSGPRSLEDMQINHRRGGMVSIFAIPTAMSWSFLRWINESKTGSGFAAYPAHGKSRAL